MEEVLASIPNYKSPGIDGIPTELFKCGRHRLVGELAEKFSSDFKITNIVKIYKKRGDEIRCGN